MVVQGEFALCNLTDSKTTWACTTMRQGLKCYVSLTG